MNRKIYNIILSILVISLPVNLFGILNTMVSLKYETENPGDCISSVSGIDLCSAITWMKVMIIVAVLLIIYLLYFTILR